MSSSIHPTAIIEDGAKIGENVSIGAYAYVGADVTLGNNCIIQHHATVEGYVIMGEGNEVFPYALIGGKTHDLKYKGGRPGLKIGNNNVFREYVTVHPATNDGDFTVIGNHNNLLAYTHVAHDCILGDHIVMSGQSALAGHVPVGDYANIAWGNGVHQFCRIGEYAMIAACSRTIKDVPPYMIAEGSPSEVRAVNKVGLERRGVSAEDMGIINKLFKIIYREGLNRSQAIEKIKNDSELYASPRAQVLVEFYETSQRGVA
ncbi:MAG: acyl-ACP--UDP-N-acetylglucosamine O-acyltransferase [Puniceicoccales bacterium]|jgi:UDP-N-acetylglucosamine acyltransferase|nr:acyl-ACP--UDP-N-acetylglucosamine O-acyltransferase [Puniceicoccales bacterium]